MQVCVCVYVCVYSTVDYALLPEVTLRSWWVVITTRYTHKYKINMYRLNNGIKNKTKKWGQEYIKATSRHLQQPQKRRRRKPGTITTVMTMCKKGRRNGTVTTAVGGDRGEGGGKSYIAVVVLDVGAPESYMSVGIWTMSTWCEGVDMVIQTSSHCFYWAIQAGLLTPLTFARHRLSPLAAFISQWKAVTVNLRILHCQL